MELVRCMRIYPCIMFGIRIAEREAHVGKSCREPEPPGPRHPCPAAQSRTQNRVCDLLDEICSARTGEFSGNCQAQICLIPRGKYGLGLIFADHPCHRGNLQQQLNSATAKPRRGHYPDGHIRGDHIADRTMCLGQPQLGFNSAAGHAIGEQNRNTVKSAIARFIKKMDDRARLEGRICHRQLMWKRAEILYIQAPDYCIRT